MNLIIFGLRDNFPVIGKRIECLPGRSLAGKGDFSGDEQNAWKDTK